MWVYDKPVNRGYTIYVSIGNSNEISLIETNERMVNTFGAAVNRTT